MSTAINLGVLLGVSLCALLVCSPALSSKAEPSDDIRIAITRDLRGYLEPCDCKAGVLGGFPRRASRFDRLNPDLILDTGDMAALASPYDHLRYRFMLELCAELGYDAITLGRREVGFSAEELGLLAKQSKVPLISGNVSGPDGESLLPPDVVVVKAGVQFGIIGLVTADCNPGAGISVLDPVKAAKRQIPKLRKRCDFLIVLAALTAAEMRDLTTTVAGIDLLLGGWVPRGSERLESLNETPCFLVQGKGQYFGEVTLRKTEAGYVPASGTRRVLGPDIPARPDIVRKMRKYQLSLADLDLLGKRDDRSAHLGSAACRACHPDQFRAWELSRHARALSSLRADKGLFDPHCLRCHATAPGSGGYTTIEQTPSLAGVGCEACHGASRSHAEHPVGANRPSPAGEPGAKCLGCHESDHSRPFEMKERSKLILHWEER